MYEYCLKNPTTKALEEMGEPSPENGVKLIKRVLGKYAGAGAKIYANNTSEITVQTDESLPLPAIIDLNVYCEIHQALTPFEG